MQVLTSVQVFVECILKGYWMYEYQVQHIYLIQNGSTAGEGLLTQALQRSWWWWEWPSCQRRGGPWSRQGRGGSVFYLQVEYDDYNLYNIFGTDYVEIISRYREEEIDEEVLKSRGRSGVSSDCGKWFSLSMNHSPRLIDWYRFGLLCESLS